ncbi:MAG: hypothetical protein MUO62_19410 [Anaerolineales bacterium]|nr:hypothetical protein [Anaerolineales bacterium]
MMDIFFTDPSEVPLPPDEVRVLDLKIEPYPDGRRLRVLVELTPFQKNPHGDIVITNQNGEPVSTASFVEAITPRFEMTLHLRSIDAEGRYMATLTLFYSEEVEDEKRGDQVLVRPEKHIVDEAVINFELAQ